MHNQCALCTAIEPETLEHMFMRCEWSKRCWFSSMLSLRMDTISEELRPWWESLLSTGDPEITGQVALIAWAIWKQRNEVIYQGVQPDIHKTTNMAHELWMEWQKHTNENKHKPERDEEEEGWTKPQEGTLKMNIDAGWSGNNGQGFGLVLRDH